MDIDSGPFLLTATVPPGRVGARLAELRTRLGLSRRELASRLGVSRWWVRRWELGTHRLPDPVVRRLLSELGLALEELIPQRLPLRYDAATKELVLGAHRGHADPADGNLVVLVAYVDLVFRTRSTPPAGAWELRTDDLAVLVELLDLDDAELQGHLAEVFALDAESAEALHGRMRRHRVAAATALAVGMLAVTPAADASPATTVVVTPDAATVVHVHTWQAPRPADPVVVTGATDGDVALATVLAFAPVATPTPAPVPAAAPAAEAPVEVATAAPEVAHVEAEHGPTPAPEVEIGTAVTVERDDAPVEIADAVAIERPAVEIGDALTIERS